VPDDDDDDDDGDDDDVLQGPTFARRSLKVRYLFEQLQ